MKEQIFRTPIIFKPEIEEWVTIQGYCNYEISNCGQVKVKFCRQPGKRYGQSFILNQRQKSDGYWDISLVNDEGIQRVVAVSRLVALHFVPNPNPKKLIHVNHKDEDKSHNWSTNLEWCTPGYNNNYGTHNERVSESVKNSKKYKESRKRQLESSEYHQALSQGLKNSEKNKAQRERLYKSPEFKAGIEKIKQKCSKPIVQLNLDKTLVREYISIKQAVSDAGVTEDVVIGRCKRQPEKPYRGYLWMYKEDYEKLL